MNRYILSNQIKDLLKTKHQKDICIPECKTGPTWYAHDCLRLDFIAIQRSWVHNNIFGYEIKINRNDFLRDNKWKDYLKFCSDFYFVAPENVISVREIPSEAGFIRVSKNFKRLFTVKKAPYRHIEVPIDLLKYILICRSIIAKTDQIDNVDFWKFWLRQRDENKKIGLEVSKKIRELVTKRIENVVYENRQLTRRMENYDDLIKFLLELGISEDEIENSPSWFLQRKVEDIFSEKESGIPGGFEKCLDQSIVNLTHMKELIDERNKRKTKTDNE